MPKRKICVTTGARAEYGLLYWLLKEITVDPDLELQLVVTGMHLSPEFGLTHKVIEADGFAIDAKVEMLLSSDTPVGIAKSIGLGVIGFADALERLQPDIMVLLGDRFEILAAAQAAMVARVPIAHIHGGEATEGLIDEAIRHSVTKMAQIHFCAAEAYRKRIIQMGEAPELVFNFGAPGLDAAQRITLLGRQELEQALDFKLGSPTFLVTFHPVTLSATPPALALEELFAALDRFPEARIIMTKPNADTNGREIAGMLDDYAARSGGRVAVYTSLGQLRYLSALSQVDVVIGNSSSGILEAPMFKKATVNIGDRQKGRLRASSVIDSPERGELIAQAIETALSPAFTSSLKQTVSLHGFGGASSRIKETLRSINLDGILMKRFHDSGGQP